MNKILIIDDFLDNPDEIRAMALSLKYRHRNEHEFFEGIRSRPLHEIDFNFHKHLCEKILSTYVTNGSYQYDASVFFHQTCCNDLMDSQWLHDRIHQDIALLAGIIFLTPDAPIHCGTQTYQKIDENYFPDVVMGNMYNRLILYPANRFHSACDFFGDKKNNRLCLLFFLNSFQLN